MGVCISADGGPLYLFLISFCLQGWCVGDFRWIWLMAPTGRDGDLPLCGVVCVCVCLKVYERRRRGKRKSANSNPN
jgi:hypothetical protein